VRAKRLLWSGSCALVAAVLLRQPVWSAVCAGRLRLQSPLPLVSCMSKRLVPGLAAPAQLPSCCSMAPSVCAVRLPLQQGVD